MSFGIRTHKPTCQKYLQTFSPRNREAIQIETLIRLSDYTPSTEPVSAMIMTNKITDEPGSGVKACKKGIK
ncbi:hypothetical protein FOE33_25160 [Salmonella enterica]|nr:hypothetical protein [Salmonella enterica subsp. enterica]ECH2288374.1 hypothetical protein [Salmonella enterica]ECH4042455.1 hypothetical protein [Salmonella enterica]ECJ6211886.1 hypothetical protein [Salmonella enterica]